MDFLKRMLETNERYKQEILEKERIAKEEYNRKQLIIKAEKVAARKAKVKAIPKKIIKGLKVVLKPVTALVLAPKHAIDGIKKYASKKRIAKENVLRAEKAKLIALQRLKECVFEEKKDIESHFSYDKIGKKEIKQETKKCDEGSIETSHFVGARTTITTFLHTPIGPLEVLEIIKNGYTECWERDYDTHYRYIDKTNVKDEKSVAFKGYIKLTDENNLTQILYVDSYRNIYTTDFENYQQLDLNMRDTMRKHIENEMAKAQLIKEDTGRE